MSQMPKRNYPITTDNVNTLGGKELILNRMVNHYSALTKAKSIIDNSTPFLGIKKTEHEKKRDINKKEEFRNVREAYKKVSSVKPYIDNKKPFTYDMKPKGIYNTAKERYEKMEHLRILEAMTKRILSIGKMHERKKNKDDPIANPTYFFRNAKDKNDINENENKSIKLISLKTLNERLKEKNKKEENRRLLGETIYKTIKEEKNNHHNKNRPKSSMYPIVKKNKKNLGYVEYDPEKYILMHTLNREGEGNYIVTQHKKELEKKNKKKKDSQKSKNASSKIISQNLPIFQNDEEQFEKDIIQFIIQNRIYSDNDFDIMEDEIIKKNEDSNIDISQIHHIIQRIKEKLEE